MLRLKPANQSLIAWISRLLRVSLLALLLGIAACGSPQRESVSLQPAPSPPLASVQPSPTAVSPADSTPPSELVADLKASVSREFGIAESQLQVQESQAVDWSDSCLGAAEAGEMCAQMITSGYRIVLSSGPEQFEFHTDRTGRSVRLVR